MQWKRLRFEVDEVGWLERATRLPELSASAKLPVLEYDGRRIEDSTEIASFLEARHPTPPLWPADPLERARCHFVEEWADEALYWQGVYDQTRNAPPALAANAYYADLAPDVRAAFQRASAEGTDEKLWHQGIGRYPVTRVQSDIRRGLDALEASIRPQGFVCASALTVADIAVFAQLHRRLAGTNPWLEAEVLSRSLLVDWLERVDRATRADPTRTE